MASAAFSEYRYIAVEGNIGAGKTSLASRMANDFSARLILEQYADNPFLPKFYAEPEKYSFPLELSFIADRYRQLRKELRSGDLFHSAIVADYYFLKSLVFARSTLDDEEYILYQKIFQVIYGSLPKPDLLVYLHLRPEKLLERIHQRGRDYERGITETYLLQIQEGYFAFFKQHPELTYLVLDVNNIDFVANPKEYERMMEVIRYKACQKGLNLVIL